MELFEKKARNTSVTPWSHLGHTSSLSIYSNEDLCPSLKRLLGMAIEKNKACGWKFVWTKDGRILARKDEQLNVIYVLSTPDIGKIHGSSGNSR